MPFSIRGIGKSFKKSFTSVISYIFRLEGGNRKTADKALSGIFDLCIRKRFCERATQKQIKSSIGRTNHMQYRMGQVALIK